MVEKRIPPSKHFLRTMYPLKTQNPENGVLFRQEMIGRMNILLEPSINHPYLAMKALEHKHKKDHKKVTEINPVKTKNIAIDPHKGVIYLRKELKKMDWSTPINAEGVDTPTTNIQSLTVLPKIIRVVNQLPPLTQKEMSERQLSEKGYPLDIKQEGDRALFLIDQIAGNISAHWGKIQLTKKQERKQLELFAATVAFVQVYLVMRYEDKTAKALLKGEKINVRDRILDYAIAKFNEKSPHIHEKLLMINTPSSTT